MVPPRKDASKASETTTTTTSPPPLPTNNPLTSPCKEIHLIVTCHGLWQPAWHMDYWRTELQSHLPNVVVMNSVSNAMQRSTCGIATAGERTAQEVRQFIADFPVSSTITKISFFGFSAGGLWVQYAATSLYRSGFFDTDLKPQFFITVATPTLGVVYQPFFTTHCWGFRTFVNCMTGNCSGCVGGRTIEELVLADDPVLPLLLQMSSPTNEFGKCMELFECERLSYGNVRNDFSVPFESSCIAKYNPYAIGERPYPNEEENRFDMTYVERERDDNNQQVSRNCSRGGCCGGMFGYCGVVTCEAMQTLLFIFLFLCLWVPVMAVLTGGFVLPVVAAILTRCWCYDRHSRRRSKSGGCYYCCFGYCCCGVDSLFPCHCLRRSCCRRSCSNDSNITKLWLEMYENRKRQNIKVIPVCISGGNSHGKIVNRPFCCASNYFKAGREVSIHVIKRIKSFYKIEK